MQLIVENEAKLTAMKEELKQMIAELAAATSSGLPSDQICARILDVHSHATNMFNECDHFAARSSLLLASKNDDWVTDYAETCANMLETIALYYKAIRKVAGENGMQPDILQPSITAFSAMQRLAKERCPDTEARIKEAFKMHGLPTNGFDKPIRRSIPVWQQVLAAVFGVLGLVIMLIFAALFPHPTPEQFFVFRVFLAVAGGAFAGLLLGHLNIESKIGSLTVRATGGFAVFFLIYYVNPPSLLK